jgi:hypothetical protein
VPARSSLWFTWIAPAAGSYQIDTRGSRFDTVLAVYTGTTLAGLTQIASNDDISPSEKQSSLSLAASAGTLYRIAVDGRDAAALGEIRLNITSLPAITGHELLSGPLPDSPRSFRLTWRSEPWTTYRIERSANLTTWSPAAACVPSDGLSTILDLEGLPPGTTLQYFRVRRE